MSAVNVIRQTSAVHVITDGAAYSDVGALEFCIPKIWPLAHLNAVVAARGPALLPAIAASIISMSGSTYDEAKSCAAGRLQAGMSAFGETLAKCHHGSDFDVIVAGWSDRQGADSYFICNHKSYPGIEPWTVVGLGDVNLLPSDPEIHRALLEFCPADIDDIDPAVDGLRILEIQRRAAITMRNGTSASIVGAFAQLTTVGPDGITTRILRRWPDVVGRKIGR